MSEPNAMKSSASENNETGLLPLRSVVVFMAAFMIAGAATGLSYLSDRDLAKGLLAGGAGFAAAISAVNALIRS
jgi:hypothetical protein